MDEITRPAPGAVNQASGATKALMLPAWLTLGAGLLLLGLVLALNLTSASGLSKLRYPAESAGRLSDRHWNFYEGYESTDALDRGWHRLLFGSRESVQAQNLALLREVLAYFEANPASATSWAVMNARARLLVGLAEAGQWRALDAELSSLGPTPEEDTIAAALRYAYALPGPPASRGEIIAGFNFMPLGWAADRLALRIAERDGNPPRITRLRERLAAKGAELRRWNTQLSLAGLLLVGAGLWLALRGAPRSDPGRPLPAWPLATGLEVLVWSALAAAGIGLLVQLWSATSYFRPTLVVAWTALLAGLPLLWLVRRRLLGGAIGLLRGFGLTALRPGPLLVATLAIFAVERAGSLLIAWLGGQWGLQSHWSQGLYEPLVFGPERTVWLAAIAMLAWSPLIEEVAFRGVLFNTLLQRWRPITAAVLSALAFAALHLYSLTAFLSVFWTGLVFAWGYRRCASLLPVILAHALGNAFALGVLVQFYR